MACRFGTARSVLRGIGGGGNLRQRRREVLPKRQSGILKRKWVCSKQSNVNEIYLHFRPAAKPFAQR
jgi:hypothetical protein